MQTRSNLDVSNFDPISTLSCISSLFNLSNSTNLQPWQKPDVIDDLSDCLRDIGIAKNDQKRLHNAGIQETQQMESVEKETTIRIDIRKSSRVEKMRIQTERELDLRYLALEKRWIGIQKRQIGIISAISTSYTFWQ